MVSWMNVADEGSTAHLKAGVQPCATVAQMSAQAALQVVNGCFERWGMPKEIKIDNGHPFVNPNHRDLPTLAKLWWIGLGINVIQNDVGRPQQNGAVECLQGVMGSWSNPGGQPDIEALQQRLDEESEFQREGYLIPSKGYKTRAELHPGLYEVQRPFKPGEFCISRVYDFLSTQVWERTVKNNGEIRFRGHHIYIGTRYKKEGVTVTFDPVERQWLIRKGDGTLLKASKAAIPSQEEIVQFAMPSEGLGTT